MVSSFQTYRDIFGSTQSEPLATIGREARRAMCQFRQNHPFLFDVAFTAAQVGVGRLPYTENATRGLWDRICLFEPIDYPPPYTIGGQCVGVAYDARLIRSNGVVQNWTSSSGGGAISGPIEIIRARKFAQFDLGFPTSLDLEFKNVGGATRRRTFGAPSISQAQDISGWDYEFFRTDGLPDNCGIAPIPRPALPGTPPPTNIPTTINMPDIGNIPVTIDLPDLDIGDWPDFTFQPRINIEGIDIVFTPDGVDINFPPFVPILPRPNPGGGGGDIAVELENQTEVLTQIIGDTVSNNNTTIGDTVTNIINNEIDSSLRPLLCCMSDNILKLFERGEFSIQANQFVNQAGGEYPLPMRCIGVVVTAVDPVPTAVKAQLGSGSAPDVLFLGWIAFGRQGFSGGDRQPWHFREQYNPVPTGCNIVVVSSNYGTRFNVSFVVEGAVEPSDCCMEATS